MALVIGNVLALIVIVAIVIAGMAFIGIVCALALDNPDVARALLAMVLHRQGGSWYSDGTIPQSGYAIGGNVQGETVNANASVLDMLFVLVQVKNRLSDNDILGIWLDDGIYYIDGSAIVDNRMIAEDMGHNRCENAIYDLNANEDIELEYLPTFWAIQWFNGTLNIYGTTNKAIRSCIANIDIVPSRAITIKDLGKLITRCKKENVPMAITVDPNCSKRAVRIAQRVNG